MTRTEVIKRLIYKTTAANKLGISITQFNRLDIPVSKITRNPYGGDSYSSLYDPALIDSLMDHKEVVKLRERSEKAKKAFQNRKAKDYISIFDRKYDSIEEVRMEAANALFNLNRYTKHTSCSRQHKNEIYRLKYRLIESLYNEGFCTSCYLHKLKRPALECHYCGGTGYLLYGDRCMACWGTGILKEEKIISFVVFNFEIEGQSYCWHMPKEEVQFDFETTDNEGILNRTEVKEINLKKAKFKEAKEIIKYYLYKKK